MLYECKNCRNYDLVSGIIKVDLKWQGPLLPKTNTGNDKRNVEIEFGSQIEGCYDSITTGKKKGICSNFKRTNDVIESMKNMGKWLEMFGVSYKIGFFSILTTLGLRCLSRRSIIIHYKWMNNYKVEKFTLIL